MKYTIVGMAKTAFTSKKNGKKYLPVSIGMKDPNYFGIKCEEVLLSEDVLGTIDIDTESGEMYVPGDGKTYYFDIDYNNRGFIVGGRISNSK